MEGDRESEVERLVQVSDQCLEHALLLQFSITLAENITLYPSAVNTRYSKYSSGAWRYIAAGKALAWHATDLGSVPSTSPARSDL